MAFIHLRIFILIGLCPLVLFAKEEKPNKFQLLPKDVYVQPGGGIRVRYENLRGATGGGFPDNEDESQASHRAQFDFKLYKGEYIETFFRFINYADWGSATGDTNGGQHDAFTRTNGLLVNQAYALWKVDEYVDYVRFGRAPLHFGLGYTYGLNDWFNVPYSFDLIDVGWDWGDVDLALVAAKIQEFTKVTGQTLSSDPEENHIIISLNIKNLFDALEFFTFNIVQVNRDLGSPDGGTTVLNGLNQQRFSIETKISGKNFFGNAFLSMVTGEEKVAPVNIVGGNDKLDLQQSAFDIKLGYNLPQSNNFKIWAGYHRDSGDSAGNDAQSETYDSFFYDVYGQSGLMDLIRWGNLSFYRAGLGVDIFTGFTIGAEWISFSRTEHTAGIQFGEAGRFYNSNVLAGNLNFSSTDTDIGNEFDIWIDRKFQSGMGVRISFSNFFPGPVFTNATNGTGGALTNRPDSDFFQFLAQVGYFF